MSGPELTHNPRGSLWHRWDPHLHAPGTLLADQFHGDWEIYLQRIESSSPPIRALGVTDYFCIQTYRRVRELWASGRLPNVALLFPNVEMRLDIKTEKKKSINLHLLFSPDDPNHEDEIERILGQLRFEYSDRSYPCTLPELKALGQKFLGHQVDEPVALRSGANQFKVTLPDLRELFRTEKWLRQNCLVAVAGSSNDGTAGLQEDDSYVATRREIERFAHIIFASTPSQTEFWLGRTANHGRDFIEQTYGALKPCLHGSDAHRQASVGSPALDRFCWLKGDLIFETLRQAVIEPGDRVWIGPSPPYQAISSVAVSEVLTIGAPWLENAQLELNPGLVAIIGARGSGKTALAEIIATGAHAAGAGQGSSSFLARASNPVDHLGEASVDLTWADGSNTGAYLKPVPEEEFDQCSEEARYLSQHFVERLCSASGLATELRAEMERVVYEATERTDRFETSSFEELLAVHVRPIAERRTELQRLIQTISEDVVKEDLLKIQLPVLRAERDTLKKQAGTSRAELAKLVPKGQKERAAKLTLLESACAKAEAKVESLRRRRRQLDELASEVTHIRNSREPARLAEMRRKFAGAELSDADWVAFQMAFEGNVDSVLTAAKSRVDLAIKQAVEENPRSTAIQTKAPMEEWPLNLVVKTRDEVKKEVGIDAKQQKKYGDLQRTVAQQETAIKRLDVEVLRAEGAEPRRQKLLESRREAYGWVFETLVEEQKVLEELYAPLGRNLASGEGALAKLQFAVQRDVDLDSWVKTGEELLDFRKESEFRGIGALRKHADQYLMAAWKSGTADTVAKAMDAFRSKFGKDLLASIPNSIQVEERKTWSQSVAAWLYSTDHVTINYGIQYEGVDIEQLSPGTRGIVLLLLYLAVDLQDLRPLIIDQPEENLDPNSVFEELVPHFREARKRRQVIIVTHNANLVVNTDADQVIVARADRHDALSLPTISYEIGSLENSIIRRRVCQILEGGERAFLERERRYRLKRE
ncbi:MAG TPA: AAA family ATPase [Candidatus Acidoferrales bacterium]|nr:AAA family ATPase [Candidatus Acidoferrales bacterium]